MSTLARDRATSSTRRAPSPQAGAAVGRPARGSGIPGDLLSLQRLVGNQAVGRVLGVEGRRAPASVVATVARTGSPLDPSLRAVMEHRLGADLGAVRLHTDASAADSARALGAKAYTAGHHVVFGPGRYSPGTAEGTRLLAHELTHVVQQRAGTFPASASALAAPRMHPVGTPAEREASRLSTSPSGGSVTHAAPAGAVMCEPEGSESPGILATIGGGLLGDIKEDPTLGEIGVNTAVSLIPAVGEVTAARDVAANVYYMVKKEEYTTIARWLGVVFSLIALFPEIGAAIKGVGKAILKGAAEAVGPIVRLMERVLEKRGHTEGVRSFVMRNWDKVVERGIALFDKVVTRLTSLVSGLIERVSSKAAEFARGVRRVGELAPKMLSEAKDRAKSLIDGVLQRFERKEGEAATRSIPGEVETTAKQAAPTASEAQAAAVGGREPKATTQGSPKPGPGQTLVGSSRSQMRRAARKIISDDPNHPLRFLLDKSGKFKPQKGLGHAELIDRPDLVQMGHITSRKLGGQERLMLQGAWENQFLSQTIEQSHIGGAVLEQEAIDIGGIAVEKQTAVFWEKIGWLKQGTVSNAPKIK